MEYMVMECHLSYAVVMDHRGQFQKVANLGYEVGQELDHVVPMRQPEERMLTLRRWAPAVSMAACLCLVFFGFWQIWMLSVGTVLIQINPQIRLHVNRLERVVSAEAVNADGAKVLFDYNVFGKPVEQVTLELSDRAADLGYLADGGEVHLTVESENAQWKTETEHRLESVTVGHAKDVTIFIEYDDDDWDDDSGDPDDDDDWDDDSDEADDDEDDRDADDDNDDSDDDDPDEDKAADSDDESDDSDGAHQHREQHHGQTEDTEDDDESDGPDGEDEETDDDEDDEDDEEDDEDDPVAETGEAAVVTG